MQTVLNGDIIHKNFQLALIDTKGGKCYIAIVSKFAAINSDVTINCGYGNNFYFNGSDLYGKIVW